jgi:hypothetical protein
METFEDLRPVVEANIDKMIERVEHDARVHPVDCPARDPREISCDTWRHYHALDNLPPTH